MSDDRKVLPMQVLIYETEDLLRMRAEEAIDNLVRQYVEDFGPITPLTRRQRIRYAISRHVERLMARIHDRWFSNYCDY